MAQRTTVVLVDDLDGGPADETVGFGLDGVDYEIDLTDAHAAALRDELAPYVAQARRAGRGSRTADAATTSSTTPSASTSSTSPRVGGSTASVDKEQNRAVREWATRHGHPLSARGRIPAAVADAFHANDPAALPTPASAPAASSAASSTTDGDKVGPDGLTGEERERIRSWALEEGIEVKARGRLTKDLIANYRAVAARR